MEGFNHLDNFTSTKSDRRIKKTKDSVDNRIDVDHKPPKLWTDEQPGCRIVHVTSDKLQLALDSKTIECRKRNPKLDGLYPSQSDGSHIQEFWGLWQFVVTSKLLTPMVSNWST